MLLDKPAGPTSHDCVSRVRRRLGTRRVGHVGTLDPFASGLLVMLVGPVTRLARLAAEWDKGYEGVARLGRSTTTDDGEGETIETSDAWQTLNDEAIRSAMAALTGPGEQRPPVYSAKKVAGRRAYDLARRGEVVELEPVSVTVHSFDLQSWTPPDTHFTCHVTSGTYVRGLARDLGESLECLAHLAELRRTVVGPFSVAEAVAPDDVTDADVIPPSRLAEGLPHRDLTGDEWTDFSTGKRIAAGEVTGPVVTVFREGVLVGVGEPRDGELQPRVVLPEPAE